MKCRLSQILPFFLVAVILFVSSPITAHAETIDMPRITWGIDELKVTTEGNGSFSSFHDGTVAVSEKGCYFMELFFYVTVNRTSGNAKVYLNDATLNISGEKISCTSSYFSNGHFCLMFSAPVDLYLQNQNFTLQCNWTYNTVNSDSTKSYVDGNAIHDYVITTTPSVSNSTFSITADIANKTDGVWGRRFIYRGPIGYANGFSSVVDSVKNSSDRAHADSQAEQQLQKDANDLQQKTNQNITKRAQEVENTMRDVGGHIANGYDNNRAGATKDKLSDSVSSMQDAESSIVDGAVSDLDSYTLPSTGILGYAVQFGQSFSLVGSMLQSIYVSAGSFNLIISVVFTLTITCMLLGIAKFFVR